MVTVVVVVGQGGKKGVGGGIYVTLIPYLSPPHTHASLIFKEENNNERKDKKNVRKKEERKECREAFLPQLYM